MSIRLSTRSVTGATGEPIDVQPRAVILGGFSARSADVRERHIAELREIGIEPPARVPAFWHMSTSTLTTGNEIEVQGERTSGEVEYALIGHAGETYVAVASDQTDREFERHSIPRSKQLCPKILSADVLPLAELRAAWDGIAIASEVSTDGAAWRPYQEAALATMLDPAALATAALGVEAVPDGCVLLSGTIPLVDGVTRYEPHFRATLTVPGSELVLRLQYRVTVLPELMA